MYPGVEELLSPSQREMMKTVYIQKQKHKGMNTALCFQPLAKHYDFSHGNTLDKDGKELLVNGKPVLETLTIATHKLILGKLPKPVLLSRSPRD